MVAEFRGASRPLGRPARYTPAAISVWDSPGDPE
jgi:hypothetical protein